ncbi:MAG TPA: hypothetical protein VFO85_08480, partial [Vicinamibacteria bacterium]|nr:hypothetical protein [Vicinamibacteria bacterium]
MARSALLMGLGAAAYVAVSASAVAWTGPGAETASVMPDLLLLLPAVLAVRTARAAGARSGEAERLFWSLLAAAAAAAGGGAALFAVWKALWPAPVVAAAAHACAFAWPVLAAVACLLRPDRARPRRQAVWAALDAGVG